MTTLGWGIVGLGGMAKGVLAPAMAAEPACELVAAVSRDRGKADRFVSRFGARRGYTDYDEMLRDPEVDAVAIVTPNAMHAEQIVRAARAGKHVLCDKPLAITVDDAERAVEACAEADVRLGVNFHYRYLPWVRDTTRLVADGTIGTIEVAQVEVGSGPRDHHGWKADRELAGLGALYNVGVHALDALGVILGAEPVEVTAMVDAAMDGLERIALVLLRFDNGTLASVRCDERVRHPLNDLVLHGSTGRVIARGLTRSLVDGQLEVLTERRRTTTGYPSPGAHRLCLAAFTDAVLAGRDPVPSGADGVRSLRLCDAISRSARERRNVDV